MTDVIFLLFALPVAAVFFHKCAQKKKYLRTAALYMISGIGALTFSAVILATIGIKLSINTYTVFSALVLGVPDVVLLTVKALTG